MTKQYFKFLGSLLTLPLCGFTVFANTNGNAGNATTDTANNTSANADNNNKDNSLIFAGNGFYGEIGGQLSFLLGSGSVKYGAGIDLGLGINACGDLNIKDKNKNKNNDNDNNNGNNAKLSFGKKPGLSFVINPKFMVSCLNSKLIFGVGPKMALTWFKDQNKKNNNDNNDKKNKETVSVFNVGLSLDATYMVHKNIGFFGQFAYMFPGKISVKTKNGSGSYNDMKSSSMLVQMGIIGKYVHTSGFGVGAYLAGGYKRSAVKWSFGSQSAMNDAKQALASNASAPSGDGADKTTKNSKKDEKNVQEKNESERKRLNDAYIKDITEKAEKGNISIQDALDFSAAIERSA